MTKKSFYLQTLYLQKPLLLIVLIAVVSTLPWLGLSDFSTRELKEAASVLAIIENGEWLSNESTAAAFTAPIKQAIVAASSYIINGGKVTAFSFRLPSALAFIALIWVVFMFLARRRSTLEAFVCCLILITCFAVHRAAMSAQLNMLFTLFVFLALLQFYIWFEKKQYRHLFATWLFLSLAALLGGFIGIIFPSVVFLAFLLIQTKNIFGSFGKTILAVLPPLGLLVVWYLIVLNHGQVEFVHHWLSVENKWWRNIVALIIGFMPWVLLLLLSVFFLGKAANEEYGDKHALSIWWSNFKKDKVLVFSMTVCISAIVIFSIPFQEHNLYILPIFPFLALFISQYLIYLVQHKSKVIRGFSYILLALAGITLVTITLCFFRILDFRSLVHPFISSDSGIFLANLLTDLFRQPTFLGVVIMVIILYAILTCFYMVRKHSNIKILMATFGLVFCMNIFFDGFIKPQINKKDFKYNPKIECEK